jgi:N-acetylmuramoyl-L-alanine amidase
MGAGGALGCVAFAMGGVDESKELFMSVPAFAKANGFKKPEYQGDSVTLSNRWNRLTLHVESRRAQLNGVQIMLGLGVKRDDHGWRIDRQDVQKTLLPLLQPMEHLAGVSAGVVVIDPGHGGVDTGCRGSLNQHEKDIALAISRQVMFDLVLKGYHVYLTRTEDLALTLSERTARAQAWQADLFVSIHLNSSPSAEAQGPETYVLSLPGHHSTNATPEGEADGTANSGNTFDAANIILGHAIHSRLTAETRLDRGLRRARFAVLRDAPCPAVLVECGYLTHPEEEKRLIDPVHRDKIAASIARGIDAYCGMVRRGHLVGGPAYRGPPLVAPPPASATPSTMPRAPLPPVVRQALEAPPVPPRIPDDALEIPSLTPSAVPATALPMGDAPLPMPPRAPDRPLPIP